MIEVIKEVRNRRRNLRAIQATPKPGPLSDAQLESLRFDTTNLSSKEQARIKSVTAECNNAVLTHYQQFIANPITNESMGNRMVLMDSDTYDVFHKSWIDFPVSVGYSQGSREDHGQVIWGIL